MHTKAVLFAVAGALVGAAGCDRTPTAASAPLPSLASEAVGQGALGARGFQMRDPIQRLLAMREDLALTAAQIARLEQIQQELRVRNQPLQEQLRAALGPDAVDREALRGLSAEEVRRRLRELREERRQKLQQMTAAEREALRAERRNRMQAVQPIRDQIAGNTRAAVEEARQVLTSEQQAVLRQKAESRRAELRDRQGRDGSRPPRQSRQRRGA